MCIVFLVRVVHSATEYTSQHCVDIMGNNALFTTPGPSVLFRPITELGCRVQHTLEIIESD